MTSRRIRLAIAIGATVAVTGGAVALAATGTGSLNPASDAYGYRMMGPGYVYQPSKPAPARSLTAARADAQRFADRLGLRVGEVLRFTQNYYAKLVDSKGNGATEVLVDPPTGLVSIEYGPAMMWNTRYGMGRGAAWMMGSYGYSMMRSYDGAMMGEYSPSTSSGSRTGTTTAPRDGYGPMGGSGYGYGGMMGGYGYGTESTGSGLTSTTATLTMSAAHSLAQRWLAGHEPGVKAETDGDSFPGYYTLETLRGGKITGMISVNASSGAVWPHWWHGAFVAKWDA